MVSATEQLKQILDRRIAIHDGSNVGEPMVRPRAPSFSVEQRSAEPGLPPGEARLRPRGRRAWDDERSKSG
jgi:hypothetical protein